jgi:hypothetical protein
MPRLCLRRHPPPRLERGLELSRLHRDALVQAYALVAPVLRRALPPANAPTPQGNPRRAEARRAALGG